MKKMLFTLLTISSTIIFAANAVPFGQEVGVTKCSATVESLSDRVTFKKNGTNKYTHGDMYLGNANNLGFDGAISILLICSQDDTLEGLQLTLDQGGMKGNFNKYNSMLKSKYKPVKVINPYVGDKYAKYKQGNSIITLDAPHMSFEMTITYATNQLIKSYDSTTKTEAKNKQKQQINNL